MFTSHRCPSFSPRRSLLSAIVFLNFFLVPPNSSAQSVPPSLESPALRPPETGSHGEKLVGMPKFHDPAPYDFDEHTGYTQIFDTKSLAGWDADPSIWRVENGL